MFELSVQSAYVICGAGALVGTFMLWMVRAPDAATAAALACGRASTLMLGVALGHLLFAPTGLTPPHQLIAAVGTLGSVVLIARALGHIAGTPPPWSLSIALLVFSLLAMLLAATAGTRALSIALAGLFALLCLHLLHCVRAFVLQPPGDAARMIGGVGVVLFLSGLVRLGAALTDNGPTQADLLLAPSALRSIFAVFYGVLPIVTVFLMVSHVNEALSGQLRLRATTDELTGAGTRRALLEQGPEMLALARRSRRDVAVLMLDLDHFKSINDSLGHAAGDRVLRQVVTQFRRHLRPDTLLARYGGEEFVALVPVDDLRAARLVAERLRSGIEDADWAAVLGDERRVTVSVGVTLVGPDETLEDATRRADASLYRAKHEGRNRVAVGMHAA